MDKAQTDIERAILHGEPREAIVTIGGALYVALNAMGLPPLDEDLPAPTAQWGRGLSFYLPADRAAIGAALRDNLRLIADMVQRVPPAPGRPRGTSEVKVSLQRVTVVFTL